MPAKAPPPTAQRISGCRTIRKTSCFAPIWANAPCRNRITKPAILDTLGMLLVKNGDTTQGLAKLQKAAQLAPNQADIRLHLAKTLIKAGDKAAARKELEVLAQASDQAAGKSATDAKGSGAEQQSLQTSIAKAPPLTCSPDCAAEVAALLKTL